jgi:hypothetical protein
MRPIPARDPGNRRPYRVVKPCSLGGAGSGRLSIGWVISVISHIRLQPSFGNVVTCLPISTYPDDRRLPVAECFLGGARIWHESHFNVAGHVPQSSGRGRGSEDRLVGALV